MSDTAAKSFVLFLPCTDIDRTIRFYTEKAGLAIHQLDDKGSVIFDTGYGYLGFVQYDDGRPLASSVCLSLNLESREAVDERYRVMAADGGIEGLVAPVHHHKFGVYSFFLKDPDGYLVEFQKID